MYVSESRLPHLLAPSDYFGEAAHQRDSSLLMGCWHVVGTTAELARDGDFLTLQIAGVPIQVRNFRGQLRVLSNVCAHRHAIICSQACGNSAAMKCQYHGWEYQADGSTGKIPEPKNFAPIDRETMRIPSFRLETAGQLVFVCLSSEAPSLRQFLGEEFFQIVEDRFSSCWNLALSKQLNYPANWKVPVENSLESYHIPNVHPQSFREDPGSDRSEHGLIENRTWFKTKLPFCHQSNRDRIFQQIEGSLVRLMGFVREDGYQQHHVFPNLLFSFTDAISLCQCVLPTAANRCQAIVRQFGRLPAKGPIRSVIARGWSQLKAQITWRILREDMSIFTAIQTGLESSHQPGVLGICEERIHRFQRYLVGVESHD